ncbi:HupE/UreJ family protein [Aestuariibacter sp. GS-14]|uniref:HupE/UreJ family protein n=1 Tax=Aestuariibacter sp. GS-14 TaxID=2590670 RepID=UPI00112E9362|nr:HupE/UreJ family protein [Aestuariibacter sp. GS-14]TPV60687.1 HupE/UreJ family protein [Aestuariibacter sp. GS-14]
MKLTAKYLAASLVSVIAAFPAFAHTGHDTIQLALIAGLSHPLMGIDHLIAMLAMGYWAASFAGNKASVILTAFFALLLAGFTLGQFGYHFAFMEAGIVMTSVITGLLIAKRNNVAQGLAVSLASCFALFHGLAHGIETTSSVPILFALGFIVTSATLVTLGFAASTYVARSKPNANRLIGLVIAMMGVSLFSI